MRWFPTYSYPTNIHSRSIAQPHNSVSDTSFYKHIDSDLPDSERVRQLLIWSSSRAAAATSSSSTVPSVPAKPLPPLSIAAAKALKSLQDDVLHMLAERRIDLSLYGSSSEPPELPTQPQTENAQNVTNRGWEVTYKSHIEWYVSLLHLTPRSLIS